MGRAVEHRWYGDVAPWSEEQLEQYCRDWMRWRGLPGVL